MIDPVIVTAVVKILPSLTGMFKNPKSIITISIENNSSHSLTDVTMYYYGDNSKPPNSIIEPRTNLSNAYVN